MARYRIDEDGSAITIALTEVGGDGSRLLEAFGECQAGQCSCPTDEYRTVATMDIQRGDDAIQLRLTTKPGEKLDLSEIAACLEYTTEKVAVPKPAS